MGVSKNHDFGTTEKIRDYYDEYWESREVDKFIKFRAGIISSCIDEGSVLDVGGGEGILYTYLKEKDVDYFLIDISEKALKIAESRNIKCKKQDLQKEFDIEDKFDYIVVNEVFEHLFDPLFTLKECVRLLRGGGKLICSFPNEGCLSTILYKRTINSWEYPHIREFTGMGNIRKFLDIGGFRITDVRKIGVFPKIHQYIPLGHISKVASVFPLFDSNTIVVARKK